MYPVGEDETIENESNSLNIDEEAEFAKEMGWYPMLYSYAKENSISINEVSKVNAKEFLFFLNFFKRKCDLDNARIEKAYKKNR